MQPLISCVCPTFGKTLHLNEAVESFHKQTYPNKELIIFNNYPDMNIVYEHPQVKVINYKDDIASIGACRNEANKYANGNYICTWDDDDIYLKYRLEQQMQAMKFFSHAQCVITNAFYSEANVIIKQIEKFMSSSLIDRRYLLENLYPSIDDDDQWMWNKSSYENVSRWLNIGTPQYIYRWNTGTYHVSGKDLPVERQRDCMLNWARSSGLPKTFRITPYWERDYEKDVYEFVNMKV